MVDYTNYKQIITITNTTDQTFYEHLNKQLNSYLDHFLDHGYEKPNINNMNTTFRKYNTLLSAKHYYIKVFLISLK